MGFKETFTLSYPWKIRKMSFGQKFWRQGQKRHRDLTSIDRCQEFFFFAKCAERFFWLKKNCLKKNQFIDPPFQTGFE